MINFSRIAQITAGPYGGEGVSITAGRVAFNVLKTDDPKANNMTVRIYNAAPSTRQMLETAENSIILNAGYITSVRQVGAGDITTGKSMMEGVDRITVAECGDGLRALSETRVSLSYDGAVTARQIIDDISAALGLPLRETDADLTRKFVSGWAYVGQARDAMTAIAKGFNLDWSVQNEQLQVTDRREASTQDAVLITSQSGLVGRPQPLDEVGVDTVETKEQPGLRIKTLLNPMFEPGGVVVLQTLDYNGGEYRIKRVEHVGDTHGDDWHSTIEVVER